MKRLTAAAPLAASLLLAAAPAWAQFSSNGGPIDITADQLELIDAQHLAIWSGAVEALQDRDRLHSDVLRIFFEGQPSSGKAGVSAGAPGRNWGKVRRAEAEGHVFFVTPTQTARADHGVYELGSDTITMTGDVILAQGQSVIHGTRLVIDTKTNHATMVSETSGEGASGRVRGIFYPNQSQTPQGAPTPPPSRNHP
jgi:lipopolysaccharide export system protein LptA